MRTLLLPGKILASGFQAEVTSGTSPELFSQDGWDIDARLYKGRDAFGVAALDPHAAVFTPAP